MDQTKGYYECPRCGSKDVFEAEEVTGAMALTLNTPGPVDPTLVNLIKSTVVKCRSCGEKARWQYTQQYLANKRKKEESIMPWVTTPFAFVFLFLALYFFTDPWLRESGSGIFIGIFSLVMGIIFSLVAYSSITTQLKRKK